MSKNSDILCPTGFSAKVLRYEAAGLAGAMPARAQNWNFLLIAKPWRLTAYFGGKKFIIPMLQ